MRPWRIVLLAACASVCTYFGGPYFGVLSAVGLIGGGLLVGVTGRRLVVLCALALGLVGLAYNSPWTIPPDHPSLPEDDEGDTGVAPEWDGGSDSRLATAFPPHDGALPPHDEGSQGDPGSQAKDAYRRVIEAYNARDRAAYFSSFEYPLECLFRRVTKGTAQPWSRWEMERVRSKQFDEGGQRFAINHLRVLWTRNDRVALAESSTMYRFGKSVEIDRHIELRRVAGRWKVVVETNPGGSCR